MKLISIITVNFNQHKATLALLESIYLYYANANIEIILVDNGSDFYEEPFFKDLLPKVKFIRSKTNLGFAGGNNLGVETANGDYLFFVNNDTEFTAGLIEELSSLMDENHQIGMVSPQINYFDEKDVLQYAGFTPMNYYTCRNYCIGQFEKDNDQYRYQKHQTGYVHGAAMMVRKTAIEKAGLMAENYFLYYEEMDWCDRIRKSGFEIWINTNALIFHKESLAVGKNSALKEFFMNRNRILFIRRNASLHQRLFFYVYFMLFVMPRNVIKYLSAGNTRFIKVLFSAIVWNMVNKTTSTNLGYKLK